MWRRLVRNFSVGFIGIGQMGKGMAGNLIKKGEQVSVFDISQEAVGAMQKLGATASTPEKMAESSDVIITMLRDTPQVLDVYKKIVPIAAKKNKKLLLIDSSTIAPVVAKQLAEDAISKGLKAVDAPVSGGVPAAQAGTLTFMCGASEEVFNLAKPYLQKMGANVFHVGKNGSGQIVKVCNNLALAIQMVSVSEAMSLGMKLGMAPQDLQKIFKTATSRCWSMDLYNPVPGVCENVPASRDYNGGFVNALLVKDLGLALEAGKQVGANLEFGQKCKDLYSKADQSKDFSYVFKMIHEGL